VLVVCIVANLGYAKVRGWPTHWPVILIISIVAAAIFFVRSHLLLRGERERLVRRHQIRREAADRLVDDMARLSPADLSIFVSAHHHAAGQAICSTAQGSSNHRVFVQMVDLGLMRPVQMQTIGEPPITATLAQYGFTPEGAASLGNLLEIVARRRQALFSLTR
jgi:hypothetical protein